MPRVQPLPVVLCDFYKVGHVFQYPNNTIEVYSNFTPRQSRISGVDYTIFFGLQYFIKEYLIDQFSTNFFNRPKEEVLLQYKRRIETSLGPGAITYDHITALHDLGYLPIKIKALKEGTKVPMRVPVLTLKNTRPEFYWLPNFLETILSCSLWQACTSATIAHDYKKSLTDYAMQTVGNTDFVQWQGHDFAFRGMSSLESAMLSGAGHLLSFTGTDTIPAIDFLEGYYNANCEKELIGGSVAATEHSVMCMGTQDDEIGTFERLITEVYPKGIVSIVSDTWNLWDVLLKILPELRSTIMARDGKVVIRPDSGDPVKIICGDPDAPKDSPEYKGVVEILSEEFGVTYTEQGYKLLDSHIGAIYGDSITRDVKTRMMEGLKSKGFASINVVLGIGSYTYQMITRDTQGWAMKATNGKLVHVLDNSLDSWQEEVESREIFKDPITDSGMKKSARGLLRVDKREVLKQVNSLGKLGHSHWELYLTDQCTGEQEEGGLLETVFEDGKLLRDQSLAEIRQILAEQD